MSKVIDSNHQRTTEETTLTQLGFDKGDSYDFSKPATESTKADLYASTSSVFNVPEDAGSSEVSDVSRTTTTQISAFFP